MRRLSGVLFCPGNRLAEADRFGQDAVTALEGLAPGRELGLAYANIAMLRMNREDAEGTRRLGARGRWRSPTSSTTSRCACTR